ncbi:MAG: tetratricopeptide repeat protein [bacterium]|nr:tetratricopeptide repeat protein [bacterium]
MHNFIHLIIILLASIQFLDAKTEYKLKVLECIPGLQSDSFQELEDSLLCLHNLQLKGEGAAGYSIYQYFYNGAPQREQNPDLAMSYLVSAARLNHPRSLDRLAWHFETGKNINRNLETAYSLYLKAAELGFTRSLVNLGRWLISGEGISQDTEAAFQLFYQASLMGSPDAQFELAHMYKLGISVSKNIDKYRTHLRRAASGGHVGAILEISRNHLEGRFEQKNIHKALQWMKTQEGNPRIDMMRSMLLMSRPEYKYNKEGLELLRLLSRSGHAPASKFISELHENGHFLTHKSNTVKQIYTRTARRQAGHLPPISKDYSKGFSSLRDVPKFLEKYDSRNSEILWTKSENDISEENSKIKETALSASGNSLKKWLNEYEKRKKTQNDVKNKNEYDQIGKNTKIKIKKIASKNIQLEENQILNRSRLIEQTLEEIKIVDPIAKLGQCLMLINNRILLANSYFSIGYFDLMNSQLEKAINESFKILNLLSNHINKKLAYPEIISAINNTEKLNAAKNLWTQSFEDLRFGSIELVKSIKNAINLYIESSNQDKAKELNQTLNELLFGKSNYGFLCVSFDENHPLNKISKSLIDSPFDVIKN